MKRIIVTPAGRKRYLEVLLLNLIKRKDEFDEWHLWLNTDNEDDLRYMYKLAEEVSFVYLKHGQGSPNGNLSIGQFFKYCISLNSLYLRLDDDIVYVKKGSIRAMFEKRQHDDSFLLIGNIVNNSICSYLHQQTGSLKTEARIGYSAMSDAGWKSSDFAMMVHENFFSKYPIALDNYNMNDYVLKDYDQISINVISWRGSDFAKFQGIVEGDEEPNLTMFKPKELGIPNKIAGNTLFCHFAFWPQREALDRTDLLERYKKLIENEGL